MNKTPRDPKQSDVGLAVMALMASVIVFFSLWRWIVL